MKNTMIHNLVKHLPGLKHIKSEFYRGFVLYTFLISAFLTLGVGNAWGANEYNKQFLYVNSTACTWWTNDSAQPALDAYWNTGCSGSEWAAWKELADGNITTGYWYFDLSDMNGSYLYFRGFRIQRHPKNSSDYWNAVSIGVEASNTKNCLVVASGGSSLSWGTYAPPMSTVTLSDNGTSIVSGSGTSGDPYCVYVGATIKVSASGTKAVADPDATINYDFKQSSTSKQNGTGTTYQFTASSTPNTTYTLNLDGYTKVGSTSSTKKAATALYYKTIAVPVTPAVTLAASKTSGIKVGETITLTATGSNASNITKYDFYEGSTKKGTVTTSSTSAEYSYTPTTTGNKTVKVIMTYNSGSNTVTSSNVSLTLVTPSVSLAVKSGSPTDIYLGETTTIMKATPTNVGAGVTPSYVFTDQAATPVTSGSQTSTEWTYTPGVTGTKTMKVTMTVGGSTYTATTTVNVYEHWTIYVRDNCSWGNIYNYNWDGGGNKGLGNWPGTAASIYSGNWRTITLDSKYSNVILHGNNSEQTNDIATTKGTYAPGTFWEFIYDHEYSGTKYYNLSSVALSDPTVYMDTGGEQTYMVNTTMIFATAHITNYGGDGTHATDMQEVGFKIGSTEYPMTCKNSDGDYFWGYITGLTPGTAYTVKAYAKNIHGTGVSSNSKSVTTRASGTNTIKVRSAVGRAVPKIYAWTDANDCDGIKPENATWPGVAMTTSITGETYVWYTYSLSKEYNKFIVSENGSNQTDDFTNTFEDKCYWYHATEGTQSNRMGEMMCPYTTPQLMLETSPGSGEFAYYEMTGSGTISKTISSLAAGTYKFKIVYNAEWYGKDDATISRNGSTTSNSVSGLAVETANMQIVADYTGSYTFNYNTSTKTVSVTYPTAYKITWGVGTVKGNKLTVTCKKFGSEESVVSNSTWILSGNRVTFYAGANTAEGVVKPGYTWLGYYADADAATSLLTSNTGYSPVINASGMSFYACFELTPYTVTLDKQSGATGYGDGGTCTNQTVYYHTALPAISGTMPSGTGVYGFMGFYTETGGEGTKVINADGTWVHGASGYTTADGKWDGLSNVTLYAYYKQAEITDIELNPAAVEWKESGDNYVKANPVIDPTPVGTVKVCWELLYDNEDPVTGHDAIADAEGGKPRQVKFNLGGLAAGNYRIRAKLYLGSSCGGTLLNTFDKTVTVTNNFTVTVFYKCGDVTIKSSTEVDALPITAKSITAPDITGYTFHHWVLGDGVTCTSGTAGDADTPGTATISYTAIFDGSLTAVYTRKRMIYFYNTLGWSTVNVYFYKNSSYWEDTGEKRGSGADPTYTWTDTPYSEGKHGTMTRIDGTNIYYFDAEAAGVPAAYQDVVFTEANQHGNGYFYETKAVRRGDYKSSLPMFVPIDKKTETKNKTDYYNYGYWMNYPENTGYTLKIYGDPLADNVTGAVREYLFPYSGDLKMPWKVDVEFNFTGQIWFMIYRNDGQLLGKEYTMKQEWHETDLDSGSDQKIEIKTSAPGVYKFTLSFLNVGTVDVPNYKYYINVEYPVTTGDYRIWYSDRAAWSGATHTASWWHASDIIRKNTGSEAKSDTVSLYVAYGSTPSAKFQKVTAINNETGAVTWTDVASGTVSLAGITEKGVYNFIVSQPVGGASISLTKTEKYTGNFYIRTDNAGSTKWDNYRAFDHQMTYSEFSFSDANTTDPAKKYSHYFASWCERGTNIQFCVANDYSACISDTLMQDVGNPYKNTDEYGTLLTDGAAAAINDRYSSNVRFMYNYSTNKISRAYVASATNPERLFLVLRANAEIDDESGEAYEAQDIPNAAILMDKENWIYEEILYITPGTRFKLFASYALKDPYRMDSVQYFRGAYYSGDNKTTCTFNASNSVILIGGSGGMQKARVIYDFKTNRLIAAWIPDGTNIDDPIGINADVLIEREHQKPAEYITFSEDGALTGVKTIYGAMKFNRWILNNRSNPYDIDPLHAKTAEQISTYHAPLPVGQQKSIYERSLYFISFPFDVNVSEIFGFGHYWDEWYLEYYDGLTRAKNGYWIDSPPNWKYVEPEMADTMVLRKNVGYILGIDLDYMQADNFNFWSNGISTVELFFPSTTTATGSITDITEVVIPSLPSTYQCTINRTGIDGDRRVKDSYWRCIGVPSFNIYNTAVEDAGGNVISWTTDYNWETNPRTFPFIYRWNMSDNTITPQATSAFTFQPMHSYLVQNGGEIHWTNVSGPSAIVARRAKKEDYREYNWRLALMSDTNLIDQTYVRMSELEQITDSFDFGQDMSKEFNAYRSDLYTKIGYERVAANSMPLNTETTTIVPVGIKVYKAGEFTLSMPDGTYGVSITLVDNNTGARTELGAGFTYSFESEAGQYDDRFYLEIAKIKDIATGTEEIGEPSKSDVRKVMINGILYIVRGDQIFDARGTRVE